MQPSNQLTIEQEIQLNNIIRQKIINKTSQLLIFVSSSSFIIRDVIFSKQSQVFQLDNIVFKLNRRSYFYSSLFSEYNISLRGGGSCVGHPLKTTVHKNKLLQNDPDRRQSQQLQQLDQEESINNIDIGDGARKFIGKSFQELLQKRKSKILAQREFLNFTSVYVLLRVEKINPSTNESAGQTPINIEGDFFGVVRQFIGEKNTKDVLLLKGASGSGKSRVATKIEEFLWQENNDQQSAWFPIYVSLPTLSEPRYNLIDQALESEQYQFDKNQIKEFYEAVKKKRMRVVFILDSYDEMRQEFRESNLYQTNQLFEKLFKQHSSNIQVSECFKLIIMVSTEILISLFRYQTRFYGRSLASFQEIEIKEFNKNQQRIYLEQYTQLAVKKELYYLYEFVKQDTQKQIDLPEFYSFWKKVEIYLSESQYIEILDNQGLLLSEDKINNIIILIKKEAFYINISQDQITNLQQRLRLLWSQQHYEDIIKRASIQHILTTPLIMEIVVQVLPNLISKYSDTSIIKQNFMINFINIKMEMQVEQNLIQLQQKKRNKMLGQTDEQIDEQISKNIIEKSIFEKLASEKWDQLEKMKKLEKLSIFCSLEVPSLSSFSRNDEEETNIIIRAFRLKALTIFDFYSTFTEFYHERCVQKLREQRKIIHYDEFLIDLLEYSQQLALDLTIRELTQVKNDTKVQQQLKQKQKNNIEDQWKNKYFNNNSSKEEYQSWIKSCSLTTLKESNLQFTHKSIQEFYVAQFLLQYLQEVLQSGRQPKEDDLFNNNQFNLSKDHFKGTLLLIKEKMNEYKDLQNQLIQFVKLSSGIHPKFVRTASNSLFLLGLITQYLGDQNFKNIHISNTNLEGFSFYNSNLKGSVLENVNISLCNFIKANLIGVRWKSIICNQLPSSKGFKFDVNTVLFSPVGKILASSGGTQNICIWNFRTWKQLKLLQGHASTVFSVSFSPDGQVLATGSSDKTIRLWDIITGKQLKILKGHASTVCSVSFSPDGQILASGGRDKTIRLWDSKTGKQLKLLEQNSEILDVSVTFSPNGEVLADNAFCLWDVKTGKQQPLFPYFSGKSAAFSPNGQILASGGDWGVILMDFKTGREVSLRQGETSPFVTCVAFSPDGQILASGGEQGRISLWDVNNEKLITILQGHTSEVYSFSFSPDGKILASGGDDQTIRLWDVEAQIQLKILNGDQSQVASVAFSTIGQILASGSWDQTIRLWDVKTWKQVALLQGHTSMVTSVAFSTDDKILASSSYDQTIRLWDVETWKQLKLLKGHTSVIYSVAFSPDAQILASGSRDQTIRLWDIKTGKQVALLEGNASAVYSVAFSQDAKILASDCSDRTIGIWDIKTGEKINLLKGHTSDVYSLSFSPNNKILASGSQDKTVLLWDFNTGKQLGILVGHTQRVDTVNFSPDGKILASGSLDRTIRLWMVKTRKQLKLLEGHTSQVASVAFSPDGQILASGSWDQTIRLWDFKTETQLNLIKSSKSNVYSVSFSPDERILASGHFDGTILLWDVNTGKQITLLDSHTSQVTAVAFSPDGQILASGSWDRTIRLWVVKTGKQIALLKGHTYLVTIVVFSPDGQMLASGSWDQTIRLWEVKTGKQVTLLEGHTMNVTIVAFSTDGKMLASSSDDGTIRFWDAKSWKQLALLEGLKANSVKFTQDNNILEVPNKINFFQFKIDYINQSTKINLTKLIQLSMEEYQFRNKNKKLNQKQKYILNKSQKIKYEITCFHVLGQNIRFQAKNCMITGSNIISNFKMDLTNLFKQHGAVCY